MLRWPEMAAPTALLPAGIQTPATLEHYRACATEYLVRSRAENTRRAYASDWADFEAFCRREGQGSLPASAETVACYVAWLKDVQGRKPSTLTRRLSALSQAHQAAGFASPTEELLVRKVMAGIRRVHRSDPASKTPLLPATLKKLLEQIPADTILGLRNRALLLVGFAGGFRRSELVALQVDDIARDEDGVLVRIRHSKTDPDGEGELVGIPIGRHKDTCPVRALDAWLTAAQIETGPLFRATEPWTGAVLDRGLESRRVARLIQQLAAKAGLDPTRFGGHSLRSGLATAAAAGGASERSIMEQTRHKSLKQVRRYIKRGSLFRDNAATFTGI